MKDENIAKELEAKVDALMHRVAALEARPHYAEPKYRERLVECPWCGPVVGYEQGRLHNKVGGRLSD